MNAYVASQLRHRRRRAIAVVAAVTIGGSLFVALTALGAGFRTAARAPLAELAADLVVTRPDVIREGGPTPGEQTTRGIRMPFGLRTFSSAEVDAVGEVRGVRSAAAALQLWDFGARSTITIAGVDVGTHTVGPARLLADNMIKGRAFRAGERGVAIVDRHYGAFYDIAVGDTVSLGDRTLPVVGVVELPNASQAAAANVYLPLADAQQLAGLRADQVNQLHVQVTDAADADDVSQRIDDAVGPVSVITEDSLVQIMGAVGEISARFSTIASLVSALGGLVLSWLALQSLVSERTREIGLLKAIGWRRRDVVRAFVAEAAMLSVIGAVVGVLLGLGLAGALAQLPLPELTFSAGTGAPGPVAGPDPGGAGDTLPIGFDPTTIVLGFLAAAGGGTVAGLQTARRAAAIRPAQSLAAP